MVIFKQNTIIMCIFYHASSESYVVGQTISVNSFQGETTRDHARRSPEEQKVNDLLDENRPQNVYSRRRCIFLFDNLQQCRYYATKLQRDDIRIYRTHSNDIVFGGYPICLVNKVYNTPLETSNKYILEYWLPTPKRWKFKEYLAKSIIIDEIIDFQANHYSNDYLDDQDTLRNFQ